jgi:peptidyl-prolyl cis-trans isomerase A (cyclophilin A)
MTFAATERLRLVTDLGELEIEVYADRAPQSAGAFLRYVDEERFVGATFYRVVRPDNDQGNPPITVVQAAVPNKQKAYWAVNHESTAVTRLAHVDGVLSLARREPGTGTPGEFFICLGDQPSLDFGGLRKPDGQGFAAFGQVAAGMEIVRRIHKQQTLAEAPHPYMKGQIIAEPIVIRWVRREIA